MQLLPIWRGSVELGTRWKRRLTEVERAFVFEEEGVVRIRVYTVLGSHVISAVAKGPIFGLAWFLVVVVVHDGVTELRARSNTC
jgi:hypothetical protein